MMMLMCRPWIRLLAPLLASTLVVGALAAPSAAGEDPPPEPPPEEPAPEPTPEPEATPEPTPEPRGTPEPTPEPTPLPAEEDLELPTPTPTPEPDAEEPGPERERRDETEVEEPEATSGPRTCHLPGEDPEKPGSGVPTQGGLCVTQAEVNRLLGGYGAAASQEIDALNGLRDSLEELEGLEQEIVRLELALVDVRQRLLAARAAVEFAEIQHTTAEDSLALVEAELEVQRDILREQAVAAYIGGGDAGRQIDAAMLSATTIRDLESSRAYGEAIVEDRNAAVDRVIALEAEAERLTRELDAATTAAEVVADEALTVQRTTQGIRAQYDVLVADQEADVEQRVTSVAQVRAQKDSYAQALGILAPASGSIALMLEARSGTADLGDLGILVPVLDNMRPGSPFGPRVHPIFNVVRMHTGIDMGAPTGAPIYAAADGVVVIAGEQGGYGNTVVIDHGDGIATLYAHQSAIGVVVGDLVEAGDVIGFVGSTGFSTGPHLHFEVRLNGTPIDPLPHIDLRQPAEVS